MDFGRQRLSLASGRDSDIRPGMMPADDSEDTFVFTVPPRDIPHPKSSVTPPESPVAGFIEDDDWKDTDRINADNLSSHRYPDVSIDSLENTLQDIDTSAMNEPRSSRKKKIKVSKYGIQYPSLPTGVVKKLAAQYARTSGSKAKIGKETLEAIIQASDWFFEQTSDDLSVYSEHASRKTIEDSDIITLMKRYVLLGSRPPGHALFLHPLDNAR